MRRAQLSSARSATWSFFRLSRLSAAQQGAHAGEQFHESERLGEVIVGAGFEAFDAIVHLAARAENQDRRAGAAAADPLEDFEAVHIRQHQIENHQIVVGILAVLKSFCAVLGDIDGIARTLEATAEEISDSFSSSTTRMRICF